MQHALSVTRQENFAAWYQAVVDQADLTEESGVRGCIIIRPWGYGVWQRMQELLDSWPAAHTRMSCAPAPG